jgi:hypothetical protein
VLDVFNKRWLGDRRHVRQEILDFIMTAFEKVWCRGGKPRYTFIEAWLRAKTVDGSYPARLPRLLEKDRAHKIFQLLQLLKSQHEDEKVATIMLRVVELASTKPKLAALANRIARLAECGA